MPSITHKLDLGSIGEHDVDVLYYMERERETSHVILTRVELVIHLGIRLIPSIPWSIYDLLDGGAIADIEEACFEAFKEESK